MEFVTQIDGEILLWIQEYLRKDFLDPVMTAVTGLGDAGWFWIAASVFLLFSKQYKSVGLTGLIALFFGFLITNLWLKNAVMRIRPYEVIEGLRLIGKKAVDFSFPSGHSTASMAASVVFFNQASQKSGDSCMFPRNFNLFYKALYRDTLSLGCTGGYGDWHGSCRRCPVDHE